jgi:hypothetical protein
MGLLMPITIRGIKYPSRKSAARALGLKASTLAAAIRNGRLDDVGTDAGYAAMYKPITIRGVTYPSRRHAADALGVATGTIANANTKGRLEFVATRSKKK